MQKTQSIFGLVAAAAVGITLMASEAMAESVAPFIVFGDSLSDAGTRDNSQATNGDVWAAQLGMDAASGLNFALGSATANGPRFIDNGYAGTADPTNPFSLIGQVQEFRDALPGLSTPVPTTAVVWIGGNDLLGISDPTTAPAVIGSTIGAIVGAIIELSVTTGLRNFIVPGLPDLGQIPATIAAGPLAQGAATIAAGQFNGGLQVQLAGLSLPGVTTTYLDIAAIFSDIRNDSDSSFTNLTQDCVSENAFPECNGFLFADPIHPTEAAHTLLAENFAAVLPPVVPLPAGMWLLLSGAGAFGAMRLQARRRSAP